LALTVDEEAGLGFACTTARGLPTDCPRFERKVFAMQAYVIAAETVNDPAVFDLYRKEVAATLVPFGGRFVVRGANLTVLEGEWPHPRLVIIAFPSRAAAEDWYRSAEYQKIISLRHKSSVGNLIIVDGFAD
jgi:uncharacterized protein (DUF1330 family)